MKKRFLVLFLCLLLLSTINPLAGCASEQMASSVAYPSTISNGESSSIISKNTALNSTSQLPIIKLANKTDSTSLPDVKIEWPESTQQTYRVYALDNDNIIIQYIYENKGELRLFLVRCNQKTGENIQLYDGTCYDASLHVVKGIGNSFAVCYKKGYMSFTDDQLSQTITNDSMYWCTVSSDFKYLIYTEKSEGAYGQASYVLAERESGKELYAFESGIDSAIPVFSEDGRIALISLAHNNVRLDVYDTNNYKLKTYSIDAELPEELEYCELLFGTDNKIYFILDDAISYIYVINLADNSLSQIARVQNTAYENGVVLNFVFNGFEYAYVKPTKYPLQDLYVVRYNAQTGDFINEFDARGLGIISDVCYLSSGDLLVMFDEGKTTTLQVINQQ